MPDAGLVISNFSGICVVTFQDRSILDGLTVDAIGKKLYELVDERAQRKVVLDFSAVRFLTSTMLSVLVSLRNKCAAIKGELVLVGLAGDLMKVFTVSHLDSLFTFAKDEAEAFQQLGK